jgi:hypothetical protein
LRRDTDNKIQNTDMVLDLLLDLLLHVLPGAGCAASCVHVLLHVLPGTCALVLWFMCCSCSLLCLVAAHKTAAEALYHDSVR